MFNIVQHCYIIGYADKEVSITAEDTTHANVILYLICRFVPFEIQSVEGKKFEQIYFHSFEQIYLENSKNNLRRY